MQPLQICIGPIIRIGLESWCLPYAGFFSIAATIRTLREVEWSPVFGIFSSNHLDPFWTIQGGANKYSFQCQPPVPIAIPALFPPLPWSVRLHQP